MTPNEIMEKHGLEEWDMSSIGKTCDANGKITQMLWMNPKRKYILMGTYIDDDEWSMYVKRYRLKVIDYDIESDTLLMMRQTQNE